MSNKSIKTINKTVYLHGQHEPSRDNVIIEKPLRLSVLIKSDTGASLYDRVYHVTLRTPGKERELIVGLLVAQGILRIAKDLIDIQPDSDVRTDEQNDWQIVLAEQCYDRLFQFEKTHISTSSCGLCGTTSLKSLELIDPPKVNGDKLWLRADKIISMTSTLTQNQPLFLKTGGVHGAGLFDQDASLMHVCEDIGRHNALDKLLGYRWKNKEAQRERQIIVLSSRVSFEIMQKVIMSAIPIVIAVGAPSDLAIKVAQRFNITLIAFVKDTGFNIYHGEHRLNHVK